MCLYGGGTYYILGQEIKLSWVKMLQHFSSILEALSNNSNIFEVESLHGEDQVDVWFVHKQDQVECLWAQSR